MYHDCGCSHRCMIEFNIQNHYINMWSNAQERAEKQVYNFDYDHTRVHLIKVLFLNLTLGNVMWWWIYNCHKHKKTKSSTSLVSVGFGFLIISVQTSLCFIGVAQNMCHCMGSKNTFHENMI